MKVTVSIPDDLFEQAEKELKRRDVSRSEFYADSLRRHLNDLSDEDIRRRIQNVYARLDQADSGVDFMVKEAARRTFRRNEW